MNKKICPVCAMHVEHAKYSAMHTAIQYVFCSRQCRDNFRQHPLLYTGKNAGLSKVRRIRRSFSLASPLNASQAVVVQTELEDLMGIEHVAISGRQIKLTYDLLQCTATQVEACLNQAGVKLGAG